MAKIARAVHPTYKSLGPSIDGIERDALRRMSRRETTAASEFNYLAKVIGKLADKFAANRASASEATRASALDVNVNGPEFMPLLVHAIATSTWQPDADASGNGGRVPRKTPSKKDNSDRAREANEVKDVNGVRICRDYVWGKCRRGDGCQYAHPEKSSAEYVQMAAIRAKYAKKQ